MSGNSATGIGLKTGARLLRLCQTAWEWVAVSRIRVMATSEMGSIIMPMIILIVIGVSGMALVVFVVAKIMKMPFCLSMATALTALYGFPPNAIITESVCTALAETPEEKEYLMSKMFAPMIVGGFTTVTITSVIIAGVFAGML